MPANVAYRRNLRADIAFVSARGAASDETEQPEPDQHDDHKPNQVNQAACGVEHQPEDEQNDRQDE